MGKPRPLTPPRAQRHSTSRKASSRRTGFHRPVRSNRPPTLTRSSPKALRRWASSDRSSCPTWRASPSSNWTATQLPTDKRAATDLGGNPLVVTKATKNPKLAATFLKFMVQADSMSTFCAATNELPTRTDLSGDKIAYQVRKDVVPVFVGQAATIQPSDVKQLTSPAMSAINTALQDQLDAAFISGQSTGNTLTNLTSAVKEASR